MEWHTARAKPADAGDRPVKGAAPGAAPTVDVVQPLRPVDADPDIDFGFGEEIAPRVVDQRAVGLKGVGQIDIRRLQLIDQRKSATIKFGRQNHRLAGMPDDAEAFFHPAGREDLRKQLGNRLFGDNRLVASVRQIAIPAVDIAKRRRLDHHQLNVRHRYLAPGGAATSSASRYPSCANRCASCSSCSRAGRN